MILFAAFVYGMGVGIVGFGSFAVDHKAKPPAPVISNAVASFILAVFWPLLAIMALTEIGIRRIFG